MTIYDDYADYTIKYKVEFGAKTLVLIEIGSFWEIYDAADGTGANMKDVSDILNIQVSKKNKNIAIVDRTNPYMAGFPTVALDKFLPLLVDKGYTVVLVGQVTPPPNPKRDVVRIVSPGTYIEGSCANSCGSSSNWIAAIHSESNVGVGIALVDLATGNTATTEAYGASAIELALDRIASYYAPCEVVCFGGGTSVLNIKPTIDLGTTYDKRVHNLSYQNEIISTCFKNETMLSAIEHVDLERQPMATIAFAMLLSFCKKHNDRIIHMLNKPEHFAENGCAFDLVGNSATQIDLAGIEKLLNKCTTAIGRRYFRGRLYNPAANKEVIEDSWSCIHAAMQNPERLGIVKKQLDLVYDVEKLYRRCVLKTCTMEHLTMLESSVSAMAALGAGAGAAAAVKDLFCLFCDIFDQQEQEQGQKQKQQLKFIQGYSPALDEAMATIDQLVADEAAFVANVQKGLGGAWTIKLEKSDNAAFFAITPKRWKDTKGSVFADFRILHQGTTTYKITCATMEDLYNRRVLADAAFNTAMQKAIMFFCDLLCGRQEQVSEFVGAIARLDFVNTCALNALHMGHVRPVFAYVPFAATGLRHPLIERLITVPYVPNDVTMVPGQGMLIYGLNAAGKSSLLKAIGVAAIMSHAGMYVACDSLTLGPEPFDALFCRISKSDDLYAGRSTFMVEMSELRTIMKRATQRSLVLADELCAGTEHKSAMAIVAAAIQVLNDRGVSFVFATHIHELTRILSASMSKNSVWHLDVYFDATLDALVYNRKLKPGQGSEIYGLEVCKSLDMDAHFIKMAFDIRDGCNRNVVGLESTRYNNAVLVAEKCGACGRANVKGEVEVHHILPQNAADATTGLVKNRVPKNATGNLVTLCSKCHDLVHAGKIDIAGYVATTKGRKLRVAR